MGKNIAVVFAGGFGSRMGSEGKPKQFLKVSGKPIIVHTLEHFQEHKDIDEIYVSCIEGWIPYLEEKIEYYDLSKVAAILPGGETGQDSIYLALERASENNPENDNIVLVHDGVRPYLTKKHITSVIENVKEYGTAITCTPCEETILLSADGTGIKDVPLRKETYAAQAPQGFYLAELIGAHKEMRETNPTYKDVIDSCTLYRLLGRDIRMVPGIKGNIKITTPEDYFIFTGLLGYREMEDVLGITSASIERKG